MNETQLKIVGCGGHSKVVIDALSLYAPSLKLTFCDRNKDLLGTEINGIPVDSTMETLSDFLGYVHVAIGSNKIRQNIFNAFDLNTLFFTVIHPAAIISKSAQIGHGAFIAARAILGPESFVGDGCIINHGAVVDHEVRIGTCAHIAPNSTLGGNVTVGNGVLVGAGAVVLQGVNLGEGAVVAAGAVVIKDVPAYTTVKGIPAV